MPQGHEGTLGLDEGCLTMRSTRTEAGEHIQVLGEIDLSVIGRLDREVRRAEATDAKTIVLDLDELEFLDVSGIRLLLDCSSRSEGDGGRLRIRRARSPHVQRVIELTGVGDVLPFVD